MSLYWNKEKDEVIISRIVLSIILGLMLFISTCMYVSPKYSVWQKELAGKAVLKESEWSRKVKIEEAKAKLESAKSLAQAEVERAKGVAEANKIIGNSLKQNEA